MAEFNIQLGSRNLSVPGSGLNITPAAVQLQNYTIRLFTAGGHNLAIPITATEFTGHAYGGGGNGGSTNPGIFQFNGDGGGGGGLARHRYMNNSARGNTVILNLTAAVGTGVTSTTSGNAGVTTLKFGGVNIVSANGGTAAEQAPDGPGSGGVSAAGTVVIPGWQRSSAAGFNGSSGSTPPSGAGSGAGGNVAGFGFPPLTGNQGMGGASANDSASNSGIIPGGGGGGGSSIGSSDVAGGAGAVGGVVVTVIAEAELTASDFNVTADQFEAGAVIE